MGAGRYEEGFDAIQRMVDLEPSRSSYARVSYGRELQGNVAAATEALQAAAPGESATLAEAFIARAVAGQDVKPGTLTIHADRGTSMTSKPVAELLADLGIGRTHSRPHVSNDNPFSEAAFKTLKYCPAFPERFGSIADARAFCQQFFSYYNHEHRHSGIGLHTPASVHYGTAREIRAKRAVTLDGAYAANPARFRHRRPTPPKLPTAAWINKPTIENDAQKKP